MKQNFVYSSMKVILKKNGHFAMNRHQLIRNTDIITIMVVGKRVEKSRGKNQDRNLDKKADQDLDTIIQEEKTHHPFKSRKILPAFFSSRLRAPNATGAFVVCI